MTYRLFSLFIVLNILSSCGKDDVNTTPIIVTDNDGNTYETAVIGNQTWTLQNLKTTTLNDGTPIAKFEHTPDNDDWWWNSRTSSMYVLPFTDDLGNLYQEDLPEDHFGFFYSHGAIESGKLAPEGWRIPTRADYDQLISYLNSNGFDEGVSETLRSAEGWFNMKNGTDNVKFNAMPSGYCTAVGSSTGAHVIANFLLADTQGDDRMNMGLLPDEDPLFNFQDNRFGGAIRLIKE